MTKTKRLAADRVDIRLDCIADTTTTEAKRHLVSYQYIVPNIMNIISKIRGALSKS